MGRGVEGADEDEAAVVVVMVVVVAACVVAGVAVETDLHCERCLGK